MPYADLHLHSSCSDGADAPKRVVERAAELGIAAIALTDHDTVDGVGEARTTAEALGILFLNATEISASFEYRELHILAYGIDCSAPPLLALLQKLTEMREQRIQRIMERLKTVGICLEDALTGEEAGVPMTGRMHVAVRLQKMDVVPTVQAGFDRYLNRGRPAFVPKVLPEAHEVIEVIHEAEGLAFLAHPGLGKTAKKRLDKLLALPFDGIEVWHTTHSQEMREYFLKIADERSLLVSGGSDCHGAVKGEAPTMGKVKTPMSCFERIQERLTLQ